MFYEKTHLINRKLKSDKVKLRCPASIYLLKVAIEALEKGLKCVQS